MKTKTYDFTKEEISAMQSCVLTIFLDYAVNGDEENSEIEERMYLLGNVISKVEHMLKESANLEN